MALDVTWGTTPDLFFRLEHLKATAKDQGQDPSWRLKTPDGTTEWEFTVPPYGTKGYGRILNSRDFVLKIGNWLFPNSMPSILVEIRSETLWHLGAKTAANLVLDLLLGQGATNIIAKPSRADLCLDLLAPAEIWTKDLL